MSKANPSRVRARALNEWEAAAYCGVTVSYLRAARCQGAKKNPNTSPGPEFIKLGSRRVRYLRDALNGWLEAHRRGPS